MYLISAYFDEASNRIIQNHMDCIAAKTGNTFMQDNHVPPHMTISSIEARSEEILMPAFSSLADSLKEGKIKVVSTGQLLPYVFYLTPVLNPYLSIMSENVFNAFKDIPETSVSRYYMPGSWLPHITIAKKLTGEQMNLTFKEMQNRFSVFDAMIVRLGLSRVNPHEDIMKFDMSSSHEQL
ncbi:MAG: hypothetical protein K6A38_10640 [Lachnospiraceae bacterium]|nr:hypothetical protein [Lachnospiraceae bacterium]